LDVRAKRTDAEVARSQAALDAGIARSQADAEANIAAKAQFSSAIIDVGKGALERARGSADTVQKAGATMVTLYTAVLAVAFSVSERPLPTRGLIPAILLGVAIALSTGFVAYLPRPGEKPRDVPDGPIPIEQLPDTFVAWTSDAALARRKWLRASVVALGIAVFFLPAPFIALHHNTASPPASDWPTPANIGTSDTALEQIVYKAQVDEASKRHTAPVADDKNNGAWWWAFGGALLAIAVIPQIGDSPQWLRAIGRWLRGPEVVYYATDRRAEPDV